MNSVQYGRLRPAAHVPPEPLALRPPLLGLRVVVVRRDRAPDVDQPGQHVVARLFGQHPPQARRVLLQPPHALGDEVVVPRLRFVEPVHVGHVQPALVAEDAFPVGPT